MAKSKALICPYCGETQPLGERCRACGGLFEPLSRQATHNQMGPWYLRDVNRPFQPGCSYETLIKLIERGQVNKFTILRGPTTKQFWTIARRVPGVSHLLGYCHNCDASVDVSDHGCHACGVPFGAYLDRNYLGLPEIRPLPWEASHEEEESRGETSSRMMDFRRAAEPLGISSFASDEELRGGQLPPGSTAFGGFGATGAVSAAGAPGVALSPQSFADPRLAVNSGFIASQPDQSPASSVTMANARHAARQRRLIQFLTIGLIAMVIVAAGALIIVVNRDQPMVATPETTPLPKPPTTQESPPAAEPPTVPEADPASETTEPPAALETIDVDATVAQAQDQIARGADESISIEERIAAYDQALRLLKKVETSVPSDQQPSDLAEQIKAVEKAVHDLRLKVYFP